MKALVQRAKVAKAAETREHRSDPAEFVEKSDLRGFLAISRDLLLIFGISWISIEINHWAVYLLAVWIIGLVQLGLGETLTHEASHNNLFKTKAFNQASELFCCLPFLFSLSDYRKEHAEHHRLLNSNREQLYHDYERHGLLKENPNMTWLWFFKPVLGYGAYAYLVSLIELATPKTLLKLAVFWSIVLSITIAGGWTHLLLLYWFIPLFWSFSSFFYWSEIEDHFNTLSGTRTNVGWTNWLTHNNGYHAIHHKYPRIPWYLLKKAHKAILPDNPDISTGFLDTFRQISSDHSDYLVTEP